MRRTKEGEEEEQSERERKCRVKPQRNVQTGGVSWSGAKTPAACAPAPQPPSAALFFLGRVLVHTRRYTEPLNVRKRDVAIYRP